MLVAINSVDEYLELWDDLWQLLEYIASAVPALAERRGDGEVHHGIEIETPIDAITSWEGSGSKESSIDSCFRGRELPEIRNHCY
jgi:hypothetical protein